MAELPTYAVVAAICLFLFVYFSGAVCLVAGAHHRLPRRLAAFMYGRAALADRRSRAARFIVVWALAAASTQVLTGCLLLVVPEPGVPDAPAGAVVVIEILAAAAWLAYLVVQRRPASG